MRRHNDAELRRLQRDYDARIRRLEERLRAAQGKPPPASVGPTDTSVGPVASATPPPQAPLVLPAPPAAGPKTPADFLDWHATARPMGYQPDDIAKQRTRFGRRLQPVHRRHSAGRGSLLQPEPRQLPGKVFALGDAAGPGKRGLSLGESEINSRPNVDPYLFGHTALGAQRAYGEAGSATLGTTAKAHLLLRVWYKACRHRVD